MEEKMNRMNIEKQRNFLIIKFAIFNLWFFAD